jgi:hypothetical protein
MKISVEREKLKKILTELDGGHSLETSIVRVLEIVEDILESCPIGAEDLLCEPQKPADADIYYKGITAGAEWSQEVQNALDAGMAIRTKSASHPDFDEEYERNRIIVNKRIRQSEESIVETFNTYSEVCDYLQANPEATAVDICDHIDKDQHPVDVLLGTLKYMLNSPAYFKSEDGLTWEQVQGPCGIKRGTVSILDGIGAEDSK